MYVTIITQKSLECFIQVRILNEDIVLLSTYNLPKIKNMYTLQQKNIKTYKKYAHGIYIITTEEYKNIQKICTHCNRRT